MGCCGDREKGPTKESQKWEFITLSDFKSTSSWNSFAYVYLWIMFFSTIVIYCVDTFTAVNLLIFNKWSSQVKPYIPFEYSKWIFAGCILFSWALWAFEWLRAVRVIRRGGVAESYMDPLAVSLQSMRSKGWRRFLVFAELTKSKKGMDLVAFFAYFAFKGAIRIILAEGPRQVINTLTLIAVVKADFGLADGYSGISLFWHNLQKMFNADKLQAAIIISMMYSLLIWAFSIICLATAAILYIVFLWHYIPQQDGGLASFCRRKIDKRLEKIVEAKVKAAIEEEERKKRKVEEKEWKAAQKAEKKGKPFVGVTPIAPGIARQPTLPQLDTLTKKEDDMSDGYSLRRTDTAGSTATLPPYASRPATRNEDRPPLPNYNTGRPPPLRSATMGSQWTTASYESDAPLLPNAAGVGESAPMRPPPAFSRQDSNSPFGRPLMPGSMGSQRPYSPGAGQRPGPDGQRPFSPMSRTDFSQNVGTPAPQLPILRPESPYGGPPISQSPYSTGPRMPLDRNNTGPPPVRTTTPFDRPGTSVSRTVTPATATSNASFSRPFPTQKPSQSSSRPFTPASAAVSPEENSYEMKTNPYISKASPSDSTSNYVAFSKSATTDSPSTYVAFKPNRTASPAPIAPSAPQRSNTAGTDYFTSKRTASPAPMSAGPQRSNTDYFNHKPLPADAPSRSLTAAPTVDNRVTIGYSDIVDAYGKGPTPEGSSHGSIPGPHRQPDWNQHF